MTTTTTPRPEIVVPEYRVPWQRGVYVARIVGPHGRFGLDREFLTGKTNKREGRLTFALTPGWYEYRASKSATGERFAVTRAGEIVPVAGSGPEHFRLLGKAARRGETIDDPGAFLAESCWCGEPVDRYNVDGRPRCVDHWKPGRDDVPRHDRSKQ